MNRAAILILAVAASIFILVKAFDKKGSPPTGESKTAVTESANAPGSKPMMEITANKKLDEGGSLVRSFFKNWEYSRYDGMHAQTVNSRRLAYFIESMDRTPIRWQNLEIISEKKVGEDWEVQLSLEVTDLPSSFAGIVVNAMVPPGNDTDAIYRFSPKNLGIERFMKVNQTWHVVTLGDKKVIDVGAGDSRVIRHSNILNYVLDAGQIDSAPPRGEGGWSQNQQAAVSALWLSEAFLNLNKKNSEMESILVISKPLVGKGVTKLKVLAKALREYRQAQEGEEDEKPTLQPF
jgi:hypothetical protein